jgi:rhombotail lipoprotein
MRAVLGLSLLILSGCASGFDRGALVERLQKEGGVYEVQDKEIQDVRALKPQLTFPCRIAIYLKPPSGNDWRWTSQDKEILNSAAKVLEKEAIASSIIPMNEMFSQDGSLQHLRMEAARYGADALLVIQGVHQTDSYLNPAAVLNLTVVGGFLIPASHRDTLFLTGAVLVDVNNGCLYASAESEGEGRIVRPTFIVEEKEAINRAKKKALEILGPELVRHVRSLHTGLLSRSDVGNQASHVATVLLPPTVEDRSARVDAAVLLSPSAP